jgi:hypothetical protein
MVNALDDVENFRTGAEANGIAAEKAHAPTDPATHHDPTKGKVGRDEITEKVLIDPLGQHTHNLVVVCEHITPLPTLLL